MITARPQQDLARAKVNLTLEVLGRRPDGYHELRSLVVFAHSVSDTLTFTPDVRRHDQEPLPALPFRATTLRENTGLPPADWSRGENLVDTARTAVSQALFHQPADCAATSVMSAVTRGHWHIDKRLPVAAGVGGGSADAAAALRMLRDFLILHAPFQLAERIDWPAIAANLGADVPVCVRSRAAIMTGIGADLTPIGGFPQLTAVLVNPGVATPTGPIFKALAAAPLDTTPTQQSPGRLESVADVMAYCATRPNDLEAPALELTPVLDTVRDALSTAGSPLLVRMSGSGATWFAIHTSIREAEAACAKIRADHPTWWCVSTLLS